MNYSEHARCPGCSGDMVFNIEEQKLVCSSCSSKYSVYRYRQIIEEKKKAGAENFTRGATVKPPENDSESERRSYICYSCGGEISPGVLSVTDKCPFCDNHIVFTDKFRKQQVPDYIIPFRWGADTFLKMFNDRMADRQYVPDGFPEKVKTDGKITSCYIPFWLFDATASGSAEYETELINSSKDGQHEIHNIHKGDATGTIVCEGVAQDGLKEFDDRITHGLEPFRTLYAKEFDFAWLSGLNAKIYDVDKRISSDIVRKRVSVSLDRHLCQVQNFDYYKILHRDYNISFRKVSYALFPIWLLEVKYHGRKYYCSLNGDNGNNFCIIPISYYKMLSRMFIPPVFVTALYCWMSTHNPLPAGLLTGLWALTPIAILVIFIFFYFSRLWQSHFYKNNRNTTIYNMIFLSLSGYFIYEFQKVIPDTESMISMAQTPVLVAAVLLLIKVPLTLQDLWKFNSFKLKNNCDCYINERLSRLDRHDRLDRIAKTKFKRSVLWGSRKSKNY